tara:strand:- start:1417 stop:1563 length:147 start_codon:yes stop_codon:yes gene_type:complete
MGLDELREKIAEEVGYSLLEGGGCDHGERQYGTSDDGLIKLCYEILNK